MFKRRSTRNSRPASAQARYSDGGLDGDSLNDSASGRLSLADSPASTGKKPKKKSGSVKRGGSFRLGLRDKKQPELKIEVVTGSFQNVASITTDGQNSKCRQVDFRLESSDRSPGFKIERRLHAPSGRSHGSPAVKNSDKSGAAGGFFVSEICKGSLVGEQQLVQVGDEIISVNGLSVGSFIDVRDVELLLRGSNRLKMSIVPCAIVTPYSPGERMVQKELFPPGVMNYQDSPPLRRPADRTNGTSTGRHKQSETDGIVRNGNASASANGVDSHRTSKSPESNASTLLDAPGTLVDDTDRTTPQPAEAEKDTRKPKSSGLKRRNSVLKNAGVAEAHDVDNRENVLSEMATMFIDNAETIDPEKKHDLLARCLAEEFNLSFFDESLPKLDFGSPPTA